MLFIQSQCLKQPAGHETLKHFYGANRVPSPFGDKGTIKNAHMQEKRVIILKMIDESIKSVHLYVINEKTRICIIVHIRVVLSRFYDVFTLSSC